MEYATYLLWHMQSLEHRKTVFLTQKKAVEYENGISYLFATRRWHKLRTANVTYKIGLTKTVCLFPILNTLLNRGKDLFVFSEKTIIAIAAAEWVTILRF